MDLTPIQNAREKAFRAGRQLNQNIQKYWLRAVLLGIAIYLVHEKDLAIDLQLSNIPAAAFHLGSVDESPATVSAQPASLPLPTAKASGGELPAPRAVPASYDGPAVNVSNLANTYSNLSNEQKGMANNENEALLAEKRRKQLKYVKRFEKVARSEMDSYGIPASITLAQGLLESNVGESKLATHNKNHFGIKCFSRSCQKGHCSNFTDDSHKDFFRIYKSSWESYRAHSLLLKRSDRYRQLFQLSKTDYRGWAHGLTMAGYATDKQYGQKLITLIEDLDLHQYDQ
ncbi:MAG: glucosaminidase domain-containing protein [Lewinellaceae bacterium]|nr:glucosaminidase domain-containing protein [Phaeodactylibacter sp.]MCB9038418.1 glucosaminidase domain-containing protein [Lewinellaceae bacterium]